MVLDTGLIVTLITAIFASSGFWAFLTNVIQKRSARESAQVQLLKGLAYERICFLSTKYLKRGYITKDEYKNLYDHLYFPYEKNHGNGTGKKIMMEVQNLPVKETDY